MPKLKPNTIEDFNVVEDLMIGDTRSCNLSLIRRLFEPAFADCEGRLGPYGASFFFSLIFFLKS